MYRFFLEVHQLYIDGLTNDGDFRLSLRYKLPIGAKIKGRVIDREGAALTDVNHTAVKNRFYPGYVTILRRGINRAGCAIENRKAAASGGIARSNDVGTSARANE